VLTRTGEPARWTLVRGDERWDGTPPARAIVNSPEILMRMAIGGAGIALVHDHFALPAVDRGELAPVLADWRSPPVSAWAVFPGRRLMPARTRVFVDGLAETFSGPACRAAEAEVKRRVESPRPRRAR
jgi:DNA-binding transcriptional LysR family regulator